jgi:hypothetical protein
MKQFRCGGMLCQLLPTVIWEMGMSYHLCGACWDCALLLRKMGYRLEGAVRSSILVRLFGASSVQMYVQCAMMSLLNVVGAYVEKFRQPSTRELVDACLHGVGRLAEEDDVLGKRVGFHVSELCSNTAAAFMIVDPNSPPCMAPDGAKVLRKHWMLKREEIT